MKILVIDDDDRMLRMVEATLRLGGHQVLMAADGASGMRVFRNEAPDIVITDIIMPQQEGLGTIIMMRRERPEVRMIAVSGGGRVGNLDVLDAATNLGADDVISKPFRGEELLDRVNQLAEMRPEGSDAGGAHSRGRDTGQALRWLGAMARQARSSS
jgi:DNA-binding response OmpR family regulator